MCGHKKQNCKKNIPVITMWTRNEEWVLNARMRNKIFVFSRRENSFIFFISQAAHQPFRPILSVRATTLAHRHRPERHRSWNKTVGMKSVLQDRDRLDSILHRYDPVGHILIGQTFQDSRHWKSFSSESDVRPVLDRAYGLPLRRQMRWQMPTDRTALWPVPKRHTRPNTRPWFVCVDQNQINKQTNKQIS